MPLRRPALSIEQILIWADVHRKQRGKWPTSRSGVVRGGCGEKWWNINEALIHGWRGLPGGDTLPRLLARYRGCRNPRGQAPLAAEQVLAWADAYRQRTGRWPSATGQPIPEASGLTWRAINLALTRGHRGLPGGTSLAKLLRQHRGGSSGRGQPTLTVGQVLAWAKAHRGRTGRWPSAASGAISEAPTNTWMAVNAALCHGNRGLPGGMSLARLLRDLTGHRGRAG